MLLSICTVIYFVSVHRPPPTPFPRARARRRRARASLFGQVPYHLVVEGWGGGGNGCVDAKDESIAAFYQHHGLIRLPDQALKLFLPLATVRGLARRI